MKKKKIKVYDYDAAEFLDSEEVIAGYLSEVFATGTEAEIKTALADVARARNMTEIAGKMKVSRTSLYKSLEPDTRTEFDTVRNFLSAVGVSMAVVPASARP